MINAAIFALWGVAIVAKLLAAGAVFRRGLWTSYPVLAAFLVVASARSFLLVWATIRDGSPGYFEAWINSQSFSHLLYFLLCVEAFLQFVRNLPRARTFAAVLFTVFFCLACGTAAFLSGVGLTDWLNTPIELGSRSVAAAALLFLLLTDGFWRVLAMPCVHDNAYRNALYLQLLLAGEVLSRWLIVMTGGQYWFVAAAQFLLLGSAAASFALWAFQFSPAGERFTPLRPDPEADAAAARILGLEDKTRH